MFVKFDGFAGFVKLFSPSYIAETSKYFAYAS